MKDWIKKHQDTLVISTGAIIATGVVAAVTFTITRNVYADLSNMNAMQMSLIASDAGVLDKIIEHQKKLSVVNGL